MAGLQVGQAYGVFSGTSPQIPGHPTSIDDIGF